MIVISCDHNILAREVLLAFWKIHILHHAGEEPIYGQGIARELRRHGYEISPGTLYPILRRLEARGWLEKSAAPRPGPRSRREYVLTSAGRETLERIRDQVRELYNEVCEQRERTEGHE